MRFKYCLDKFGKKMTTSQQMQPAQWQQSKHHKQDKYSIRIKADHSFYGTTNYIMVGISININAGPDSMLSLRSVAPEQPLYVMSPPLMGTAPFIQKCQLRMVGLR